ncbi:MAG: PDZ domain-containing protein [Proteobacteria bacterium]|nr:PDZ domain-containing protein [Pseudomonadota bacterium]
MRKFILVLALVIPLTLAYSSPLLKNPVISLDGKKLLFAAHGDIYEGSIGGGRAYSITNNAAYDGSAVYSKDGNYIAFSSDRNGISRKVYVYDRKGDSIYQVTFGRGYDYPLFFDHGKIVFLSRYRDYGNFIFSVPLKGGIPVKFFYGKATNMDANDRYIAYEYGYIGRHRYKYKGSAGYDIFLKVRNSKTPVKKITTYKGNDIKPKIRGFHIYYISSMKGNKYDIYRYDIRTGKIDRVTKEPHNIYAFDVSKDGKILVFEEDYTLYKMSSPDGKPVKLNFSISPDMAKGETYFKEIDKVKGYAVSPINDSLFAINAYGEIFLYYPGILNNNLTNSPYWDKAPKLNKDGSIYFVSDRSGYFNIYKTDTLGNTKMITNDTLPERIRYVSDKNNEKIIYTTPLALYITDNGKTTKLDSGSIYDIVLSPHERYIAYSKLNRDGQSYSVSNIYVYDTQDGKVHRLTTQGYNASPVSFSKNSKKLYFTLNYNIRRLEYYSDLHVLDLTKPEALYKKLIIEKRNGKKKEDKEKKDVDIVYKNINARSRQITHFKHLSYAIPSFDRTFIIVAVPNYKSLYFYKINLKKKDGVYNYKPKYLLKVSNSSRNGVSNISLSEDGKFLYYISHDKLFSVNISSKSPEPVSFSYNLKIDKKKYYRELFNAAWLMLHDYFYDPGYHGLNWNNEKKKYEPLMNRVNDIGTLSNIVYNMIGDLNASHTGFYPSDEGEEQSYGDLGIRYTIRNYYPYVTKIYAKGPCDKENVRIKTGDYIVSIDGNDLKDKDPAEFLLNKVNKKVTVGVRKYIKGKTRKYAVVPVSGWTTYNLMYNDWVRHEEHIVDSLSHGELGYIHIRGMGNSSYYKFLNEILFKYSNKKGLVLDVRGNGGGFSHDYYITFFMKKPYMYTKDRYEKKYATPLLTWAKPVDLLINEKSFSNAEMFPYSFRHMGIGKLIGVPTAGGVIGTYDIKLFDGTGFRLPEQSIMRYNGVNFENHAVQPDIYVENPPEDLLYNRDSQLEKAVEYLMSQIKGR